MFLRKKFLRITSKFVAENFDQPDFLKITATNRVTGSDFVEQIHVRLTTRRQATVEIERRNPTIACRLVVKLASLEGLPNADGCFEINFQLLVDLRFNKFNQLQKFVGGRAFVGNKIVRVAVADLYLANSRPF